MTRIDPTSLGDLTKPAVWDGIIHRGRTTMQRLVDLEMPIIAAANGSASTHSEWVLMADIAVAEESTVFSDFSHPDFGTVPGDGVALIWQEVLGINRTGGCRSPAARSPPARRWSGERSTRLSPTGRRRRAPLRSRTRPRRRRPSPGPWRWSFGSG